MIAQSILFAGVFHLVSAGPSDSARDFNNEIGLGMGWGNPFGSLALEYWRHCGPRHELGAGAGLGTSGYTFGLGYKRYFQEEIRLNPWIGVSSYYASGSDSVTVIEPQAGTSKYHINSGFVVHPRIGLRYQAGWMNLHFGLGWGFTVAGGGVEYVSDLVGHSSDRIAQFYGVGGPEVSMGMMYRI